MIIFKFFINTIVQALLSHSIISFTDNKKLFPKIKKCFKTQFKSAGFESSVIVTKIGKGARVIR